ncbi:NAD(P)/FAD-dependent oxidoreductase [Arthrobacter sp. MMS18-M83]|uniref:NAD(P)/FAD-dependent oxidoreductase n=1 Tax=Arthrobacter sp. MMS18-M83 TaxID=2996261 RepID=UPI00227B58A2|nr:FAD-dependent oxidoreductase [Arthrobacter sp. MMS18-M83]WAH96316.1 FAD-dependent oxidoreductase [Arthrobacter sp. MMS18-M83]
MSEESIVIIGAGHAGVQAAVRLTELGWPGRIVLVEEQDGPTYERPPLSKEYLKAGASDEIPALRKEHYFDEKRIERIKGSGVVGLDREARNVTLSDGGQVQYSKLIIATGSQARPLTVPGSDLPGIHLLKTRADAEALRTAMQPGSEVVIIGAGYIGLEVAAAAAALGCATTVLEFQDRVMSRVTSDVVSRHFEELHQEHDTRFVFGTAVTEVRGDGRVQEVVTADGATYAADVVVAGIGVVPRQELAEAAGITVKDGIVVDLDSRTSDPSVYAVGDVTRLIDEENGINRRLESIQSALAQAINAANHIMGQAPARHEVPWFWTVQHGVRLQTAGLRSPDDDVVVRGTPESGHFSVLYLRGGRLAAIDTIAALGDFTAGKKLVASGAHIDTDLAADPANKLTTAVRELVDETR